jgi:hypothetical protein
MERVSCRTQLADVEGVTDSASNHNLGSMAASVFVVPHPPFLQAKDSGMRLQPEQFSNTRDIQRRQVSPALNGRTVPDSTSKAYIFGQVCPISRFAIFTT